MPSPKHADEPRYKVTYNIKAHPEGVAKSEVVAQGLGGCDCAVIVSIIGQPGGPGPLSVAFPSINGSTGEELTPQQEFQVWSVWAHQLMDTLGPGTPRGICRAAFESTAGIIESSS